MFSGYFKKVPDTPASGILLGTREGPADNLFHSTAEPDRRETSHGQLVALGAHQNGPPS